MVTLSIKSYCTIQKNTISKNGAVLFTGNDKALELLLSEAYSHFEFTYPKFYKMDSLSKLGWLTAELLMQNENINKRYNPENIGIVLSNSNASLNTDIHYVNTMHEIPSPALFVYTLPNIVIGEIAIRNNFKGENAFFISEQFDAILLYQCVNMLFSENAVQSCICGWIDAILEDYKCVLYLVEKQSGRGGIKFTEANINKLFNANA